MSKKTGIVMKITEKYIVLMMPDGSFKNVNRSYDHTPLLGEFMDAEMSSFPAASLRWISVATAAVCMIIAALLISGITRFSTNPAFTVALDINPSMEIQVGDNNKTIGITALNDDADNVLKNLSQKNKELNETLSEIIDICVTSGYLSPEKEGLISVSVILANEKGVISKESISDSLQNALDKNNINAGIDIKDAPANALTEAHKLGMSVNRYIIFSELAAEGAGLSAQEAGRMSMSELKRYSEEKKYNNNANGNGVQGNNKQDKGSLGNGNQVNTGKENGKINSDKQGNNKVKPEEPKEKTKGSNGGSNPDKQNNGSSQNAGSSNNPNENSNGSNNGKSSGNNNSGSGNNSSSNSIIGSGSNSNSDSNDDSSNSGNDSRSGRSSNDSSKNGNSSTSNGSNASSNTKNGSASGAAMSTSNASNNEAAAQPVTDDEDTAANTETEGEDSGLDSETGSKAGSEDKSPDQIPKPPAKK